MKNLTLLSLASVVATMIIACRPAPTPLPEASDSGGFVVTLGNDTVSAETFTRAGDRIEGVVMRRVPRTAVVRYTLTLGPTGLPTRLEYTTRLADGSLLPGGSRSVTVTFTGDSAITEIIGDSTRTVRAPARNAYPEIDGAVSLYGLPIAALRIMNSDSARFLEYPAGAPTGNATPVARRAGNSWRLYSAGDPIDIVTDDGGRVLSVDATQTTFRIRSQRQTTVDVAAIATDFARREGAAGPLTALSPRDTVEATIGGVRFWVDYSRPAVRGRRIFGPNGVLGDTLWRTGANQETQFRIDAPIVIGGQTLPAGTYTLMTLAIPGRYQLIFFEGGRERLRVPLQAALIPKTERFTIVVQGTNERSGMLRLHWDTMELSVPFTVP
jgi:hypothetical protein